MNSGLRGFGDKVRALIITAVVRKKPEGQVLNKAIFSPVPTPIFILKYPSGEGNNSEGASCKNSEHPLDPKQGWVTRIYIKYIYCSVYS